MPSLRHLSYQYDVLDNVTQREDAIQQLTETFDYDNLNRLIGAMVPPTRPTQAMPTTPWAI